MSFFRFAGGSQKNRNAPGILILLALVCLILPLGACKEKKQQTGTTLTFITWKPNQPEVWEEVYDIFVRENPDITIRRETGPHSSTAFHDLLVQKLRNRSKDVDVFLMDVIWPPEFAAAGWAAPLNAYFPVTERKEFLDSAIEANIYEENIYGVPLFIDSGMLYYRKDLLDKYGLEPPVTWGELVQEAKQITQAEARAGLNITGYSGQFKQYEGLVCDMLEFILSNRGHIVDPSEGRSALDREPALAAVRYVRDEIIGNIAPPGVLTYQEPESLAVFIQGRAVFHRNWPYAWEIANNGSKSAIAGHVGIARLPHFPGGESHAALGGWQLGISNYSDKKEAAWRFIHFLSSPRIQKIFAQKSGKFPARTALYQDADVLRANPHFASMAQVFTTATPRPSSPLYPAISNVLQRYFSAAISRKDSSLEEQARAAGEEIDRLLNLAVIGVRK